MADDAPYYVYIYRDPLSGEIRYVGKGTYRTGASRQRVEHHAYSARNAEFRRWVERLERKRQVPSVELFPCTSEEQAFRVEAALISALWADPAVRDGKGLFNKVHGQHGRFVPIGLPGRLADRHYQPPLVRQDLADLGGALVVYVSSRDFQTEFDDRRGAFPHYDLTDDDVRDRVLGWWQIGKYLDRWHVTPAVAPALLVGVTGPPARRWVWGAVRVSKAEWAGAEWQAGGLYRIPADGKPVDARRLRGRLIQAGQFGAIGEDGSRRFGAIRAQFFDVVDASQIHQQPQAVDPG
jgi:hypothetical protein